MKITHPTSRRLRQWLDGADTTIDSHVSTCRRCANRLEDLAPPVPDVRQALETVLAPPAELVPRLEARLVDAISSRDDLKLLFELMGLPWETARTLLKPAEPSPTEPLPTEPLPTESEPGENE